MSQQTTFKETFLNIFIFVFILGMSAFLPRSLIVEKTCKPILNMHTGGTLLRKLVNKNVLKPQNRGSHFGIFHIIMDPYILEKSANLTSTLVHF